MNRLTNGNKKVKAWLFSLPPISSCLNSKQCAKKCYATKAYRMYPTARALWDMNFEDALYDLPKLEKDLETQLTGIVKKSKNPVVRIHQSGDFISADYIKMWTRLADKFKTVVFYGYTKVDKIFEEEIKELDALPNVNIIPSFLKGGHLNFGSRSYVLNMYLSKDAFICPATYYTDRTTRCGVECDYCFTQKNVVFVEH